MTRPHPKLDEPQHEPGYGIDTDAIRALLALTPTERLRQLVAEARNLARFDAAIKRGTRQ